MLREPGEQEGQTLNPCVDASCLIERHRQTDRERESLYEGLGTFRLKVKDGWSNGRMDGSAGPLDPPIS